MEPADYSYSSVDWIIKDIMESYPSLERVKTEQTLRKQKLDLTSALLDLRVTNFKEKNLGVYEKDLEKINVLKNRFVESVYQFLNQFGHELCDDDRILYRDEVTDVETKVLEHSQEIRKMADEIKALQHYQQVFNSDKKSKANTLETILEICKEIDEDRSTIDQEKKTDNEEPKLIETPRNNFLEYKPNNENFEKQKEPKDYSKHKKSVFSYSVKKEITETMTLTEE